MKQKQNNHLHGQRGQAFANKIRGINPEQILCVSIDISKDFHLVLLHNKLGEIVMPRFDIDIFQSGYEQLCQAIETAVSDNNIQLILIGMEPTGHYYQNLACHLHTDGYNVTIINSLTVKQNRDQQMMSREKSDEIDAAAIGDLLQRGHGSPYHPPTDVYLQLQQLDRERIAELKVQTMYKNRIIGHLDRIWPGLILTKTAAKSRYKPLFATDFWSSKKWQELVRVCPDPREIAAMSPAMLIDAFHEQGFPLGVVGAHKYITYAQKTLWAEPEMTLLRRQWLERDLAFFDRSSARIDALSAQIEPLLAQTPYQILSRFKGISVDTVASFAAAVGDPAHYACAAQIFRRSGLVSGRADSGANQRQGKGKSITKTGDVYLRRALGIMAYGLILHQPVLSSYYHRLAQYKKPGVARVALLRRTVGILWATVRDQRADTLILREENRM